MRNRSVSQSCIDGASYVPETYRLNVKNECKNFFSKLTKLTADYKSNIKVYNGPDYLLKTDEHRGEGIRLLFPT